MAKKRRRRKTTSTRTRRRYYSRRPRRNPYRVVANPRRKRRRRRYRRNPLIPTGMFQRGLAVAAGFLLAPKISEMIPFALPGGKLGQYAKEFIIISIGSQIANKALGRKYGNALFAGGVIHIGVDMLQTYVPAFGGSGMGYYFPPDDQLALTYGTNVNGGMLPVETFESGIASRFSNRW